MLPKKGIDLKKWSVVACDQYTSQPEYWDEVERLVKDAPSTLRLTYPEIYLGETYDRMREIHQNMDRYIKEGILEESVHDGFVLTVRTTESGKRIGLVGNVDLESYDFHPEKKTMIRATEKTVEERIPPRMKVRKEAIIELPHVMLLVDDLKGRLIEALYERRDAFRNVYETELMMGGGHIAGYAIEGEDAVNLQQLIQKMEEERGGLFLVTGDGNHSLATAKACWENMKRELVHKFIADKGYASESELEEEDRAELEELLAANRSRYALVEVVNLHSEALVFEPIHRLLTCVGEKDVEADFEKYMQEKGIAVTEGTDLIFIQGGTGIGITFGIDNHRLPVDLLQEFLDDYVKRFPQMTIDYIHGEETIRELSENAGNCGMILGEFRKEQMFDAIEAGGVLPRKTFSVGHANEKRYYMESRVII